MSESGRVRPFFCFSSSQVSLIPWKNVICVVIDQIRKLERCTWYNGVGKLIITPFDDVPAGRLDMAPLL